MDSFARILAVVRTSVWSSIALKVVGFVFGLLILAWVGRVATAAPATPAIATSTARPPPVDAGTPPPIAAPPPVVVAAAAAPSASSHGRATADDPVFVNQADVSELRRLPGVGPKRAEAIVALRQRVGRFQRAEELLRVKGVGRATLRKWRPLLRLDTAAPSADAGAAQ